MKKKFKHLSMLLIIALMSTCCIALSSCGGGDDKDEPSGGDNNNNTPTLNLVGTTIAGTQNRSDGAYKYADTYSLYFKTSSKAFGKIHTVVHEISTGKQTGVYDSENIEYKYVIKTNDLVILTESSSNYQSTLSRVSNGWLWSWPNIVLK